MPTGKYQEEPKEIFPEKASTPAYPTRHQNKIIKHIHRIGHRNADQRADQQKHNSHQKKRLSHRRDQPAIQRFVRHLYRVQGIGRPAFFTCFQMFPYQPAGSLACYAVLYQRQKVADDLAFFFHLSPPFSICCLSQTRVRCSKTRAELSLIPDFCAISA